MRLVVEVAGTSSGDAGDRRPGASQPDPGEYRIEKEKAVLGRGAECDVVLLEQGVSRQHARLQHSGPAGGGTWHLIDLGATNGTLLNGRRLQPHQPAPLHAGDRISIGSSVLVVSDLTAPKPLGSSETPKVEPMSLHPAVRAVAALLFVVGLVLIVALLVIVLQPEPRTPEAVAPTAAGPLDVISTVLPTGVPEELLEPLEQLLTSQPGLPLLGTREP